jgi:putative ABC transport system substrate-binding protein
MILTLALGLLAAPLAADGQQATKVRRIGILDSTFSASPFTPLAWMGAFGYAVGRDIIFESRSAGGEDERLPSLAAELVGLGVEVLIVNGRPAVQAARKATGTIPIVMIGLPAIFPLRTFADRALLSYAPSRSEITLRVAAYVDKILKGAKPADLPVEEPREFDLVINRASRES